jgi:N-acetylglucosamine kinase-like BadF-type ATPase
MDTRAGAFILRRRPAVPWDRLAEALAGVIRAERWGRPDRLVLGSTGIWSRPRRAETKKRLRGLATKVLALSDIELAQAAAFAGGPGILVVGGTGSIAFGRDGKGGALRAGGLGALLGDEGSAFWIGRQVLRDPALRAELGLADPLGLVHAPRPVTAIAGLAPAVFRLARGCKGFSPVRRAACRALAGLCQEVRAGLRWKGQVPLSWRGGLFRDRDFLETFLQTIKAMGGFEPKPPLLEAEVAAALLPTHILVSDDKRRTPLCLIV